MHDMLNELFREAMERGYSRDQTIGYVRAEAGRRAWSIATEEEAVREVEQLLGENGQGSSERRWTQ